MPDESRTDKRGLVVLRLCVKANDVVVPSPVIVPENLPAIFVLSAATPDALAVSHPAGSVMTLKALPVRRTVVDPE